MAPFQRKSVMIRMDNRPFFMTYIDAFVRWVVFDEIEVQFLSVLQQHCDIEQALSFTSNRLRTHDSITLSDITTELCNSYFSNTIVTDLKQIVNCLRLCYGTDCVKKLNTYCTIGTLTFHRHTHVLIRSNYILQFNDWKPIQG